MLVLSRKVNESLVIGDNVVVTVLAIDREKIKLGIQAPREITVLRQEIYQAVQEQILIAARLTSESEKIASMQELRSFLVEQFPPGSEGDPAETGVDVTGTKVAPGD